MNELSNRTYGRQRLHNFGLTMIVMGICFIFYYLGFFGNVKGPLNPAQVGETFARLGVSKTHVLVFACALMVFAITWNWLYNLMKFLRGSQLTCNRMGDPSGPCGAPVIREKIVHEKTGQTVSRYVCPHGHKRPAAHFHPVKKGIVSHTLWVMAVIFCLIVFYACYHLN
jgi:hypothetical protein